MKRLYLIPLPAIIIGPLAMYMNGVSTIIWSQNIFASLIMPFLAGYHIQEARMDNENKG